MPDTNILSALSPEELFIVCSYGGRILHVSTSFTALIGIDLVGKNLNDIIEDRIVSRLIINVNKEKVYEFDCVINGRAFSCGAKLSESDNIIVVLDPAAPDNSQTGNAEIVRYMGREINANIEGMSIAFGALAKNSEELKQHALGLLSKSMMNLARISKNAVTKVDYEQGNMVLDIRRGDMLYDIAEVCQRAASLCESYADIAFSLPEETVECLYDSVAVKRIILNLIAYNISSSPVKYPRIGIKTEHKDSVVTITVSSVGAIRSGGGERDTEQSLGFVYGKDIELDMAVILTRKHRGSLIITERKDGGRLCRVTLPVVKEAEGSQQLSSTIIDWYGGMDFAAIELSGVLPPEAFWKDK